MIIRSYPPKEFHRGLYVTYYDDRKDFYMSTDLRARSAPCCFSVIFRFTGAKLYALKGEITPQTSRYYEGAPIL